MTLTNAVDDTAVQRFEATWRAGQPEALERFLPTPDQPTFLGTLAALVCLETRLAWEAWKHAAESVRGNRPALAEDYLRRFPQLGEPAVLLHLLQREYLARIGNGDLVHADEYPARFPNVVRTAQDVRALLSTAGHETNGPAAPEPNGVNEVPRLLGRYRVVQRLGVGSFGTVYRCADDELGREVAVKVPHRHLLAQPEDQTRYRDEARLLACLDHPHIVPVYDVGTSDDGLCFIVTRFIDGSDLAHRLPAEPRLSFAQSAELTAAMAEALHHAHLKGLVHRDVKPANILLDRAGCPFLGDFGLALREQDFGQGAGLVGTPFYMSPEQARGEGHRVDGRSDIFSLGVVFYELLTGRLPYHAQAMHELLAEVIDLEARPPRQINDHIPRELERICLKTLAKRVSERYPTAADLAAELRHFLGGLAADDQPAPVQVVPNVRESKLVAERNADRTELATGLSPSLHHRPTVVAPGAGNSRHVSADTLNEQLSPVPAAVGRRQGRGGVRLGRLAAVVAGLVTLVLLGVFLYRLGMGQQSGEDNSPATDPLARDSQTNEPLRTRTDPAGAEHGAAPAVVRLAHRLAITHKGAISSVAFTSNGKEAVSAVPADHTVHRTDLLTGKEVGQQWVFDEYSTGFVLSGDGNRLLGDRVGDVHVWDTRTGKDLRTVPRFASTLGARTFSRTGRFVAVARTGPDADFNPKAWVSVVDLESGKVMEFTGHDNSQVPAAVALSGDGRLGASASSDGLRLWAVADPPAERLRIPGNSVTALAFAQDGLSILAGQQLGSLVRWDVKTGKELTRYEGHDSIVNAVAVSPNGTWMLTGSDDKTARLWDVRTGKELAHLVGHTGPVTCLAFSPEGKRALTGSADNTVRLWELPAPR